MPSVTIPYTPRPLQAKVHAERKRFTLLLTHRRFGKTVFALNELIRRMAINGHVRDWRAGYVAPWLKQAKDVAWDYCKYYAGAVPGVKCNETELSVTFPHGGRIRLYGADNPDSLRGKYFDDLALDEAADISRSVWNLTLLPTLADRRGWALFMGTPKGVNNLLSDVNEAALEHPETWGRFVFKASETGYLAAEELAELAGKMSEDEYAQEMECSFAAAVRGAYWSREIDALADAGRIGAVPYEPLLPVYTAWDLGMDDATSIWFFQLSAPSAAPMRAGVNPSRAASSLDGRQLPPSATPRESSPPQTEWRFIDYYENSGEGLEHYAAKLREKGYVYGRHIAPHDIMVRELGTGKSRFETARALGIKFHVARNLPVIDGISAVRRILPLCRFDAIRCAAGVKALRQYQKTYNARMEVFGNPQHDWTSHTADAFRYAVVGMMPEKSGPVQEKTVNRIKARF
ncbi:hypothetical protein FACS1894206_09380 [Deltaproteobacteria bacterium]|nr:hypothetical protein FACS1894206_09380 [Deltaproteobacteria bacterium]